MRLTYDLNYMLEQELAHDDSIIKPKTFSERIALLREYVFNFEYPIDEKYQDDFETAFCSHFLFKEMGFSTFTRWHFELQSHLAVHGMRYNNLYQAEIKDIADALNTIDIENLSQATNTQNSETIGEGSSSGLNESFNTNRVSDTPQGRTDIDGNYISGLSDAKQVGTSTGDSQETNTQTLDGTNTGTSTTKGYSGLTKTQLHRIYSEQMIVANEIVLYNMERLFLQTVI